MGVFPKMEIKSTAKLNTITGKFIDEEKQFYLSYTYNLLKEK